MSVEGLIGSVMLLITSVSTGTVDSKTVWNTAVMIDRASQHKNWSGSVKEESYSGLKKIILRAGQR